VGRKPAWADAELQEKLEVAIADLPEPDPDLLLLKVNAVVFGPEPWGPDREKPATLLPYACDLATRELLYERCCRVCGGDRGPIQTGSRLYCAACNRSGSDHRIAKALALTPSPKPDRKRHWKQQKGTITVPERYADRIKGRDPT
jgi:hypothetical protein